MKTLSKIAVHGVGHLEVRDWPKTVDVYVRVDDSWRAELMSGTQALAVVHEKLVEQAGDIQCQKLVGRMLWRHVRLVYKQNECRQK